jgi:hypothetical protein
MGVIQREVGEIGLLREGIPFARKHAVPTVRLIAKPDTTNPREEINEGKRVLVCRGGHQGQYPLSNDIGQVWRRVIFTNLPATDSAHINVK